MLHTQSIPVSGSLEPGFRKPLEKSIKNLFASALKAAFSRFGFFLFLLKFTARQRKAARKRNGMAHKGLNVPPFMIVSVTSACNLKCSGCYSKIHHAGIQQEMNDEGLNSVFTQAGDLGVSIALLAGGEPFKRKGLLDIVKNHKNMLFPVFTNGLLIDESIALQLKKQPNVIPVLSIEGTETQTDQRRGSETHTSVMKAFDILNKHKIFFGVSFTVCRDNLYTITDGEYLKDLYGKGARLFFYNEYVPFEEGSEDKCLYKDERELLEKKLAVLRADMHAMFLSFPGDESVFDGCLSAGRGFFHVNPAGKLEPCPFAPYSKDSLLEVPLAEALQSRFLQTVRSNHSNLYEEHGGCALWNNREWLEEVLQSS